MHLMNTYNRYPITLVRGEGVKVWDEHGKEYLDFIGGLGVNILGHCHSVVVEAITSQAKKLIHASNLYHSEPAAELAKWLTENGGLDEVFFCNSGTEANEGAIKLARKYQWRKKHLDKYKIFSATNSFHGRTLAALTATQKPALQEGFGPLAVGFEYIQWNNTENLEKVIDEKTAAVLLEPIQGEGGVRCASYEFLTKIREACDRVGALLIFDEIQCGLGRSGALFAYEKFGVKPDIITLAKGMGGGLPLGAICATHEAAEGFHLGDHGSTFGGNPVSCAAGLATLKTLITQGYPQRVEDLGAILVSELQKLQKKYPHAIEEVRGLGLMIGIELKIDAKTVLNNCYLQGLLVNLTANNVIRLLPPYIISEQDIEQAVRVIENSICNYSV